MRKQDKLISKSVLPIAMACAAMTFTPSIGVQKVMAEVHDMQQAKAIKGTIVDENGEPVIGATIVVMGGSTQQGTVSDFDGNFGINAKPGQKLKITYIGYEEMIVPAKQGMQVQLKVAAGVQLQGIEVVAYGVQKKVTVTGAISSVKSEDLVRTSVGSVNNGML